MNRTHESHLPDYLNGLEIKRDIPPVNQEDLRLPYDRINPLQFELFCCELVRRRISEKQSMPGEVVRIEPLAGPGRRQFGADIFCLRSRDSSAEFELFEVKRIDGFRPEDLKRAVERFKEKLPCWGFPIKRFTIIFSDDISSSVLALWRSEALVEGIGNVELDLWSKTTLDGIVSSYPELVYRFFHPAWTEQLFGKQAVLHFERYGIYDFQESASWEDFDGPYSMEVGDTLVVHNDYVRLHAFLPSRISGAATCSVELRNGRFSHVSICLNEPKLVRLYFPGYGSPPESEERPFLLPFFNDKDRWVCDLGNCRITISYDEATALCKAFDTFYEAYESRILAREEEWRCLDFETYEGLAEAIPLVEIKRGLWRIIRRFIRSNDAFSTEGVWSMFDASGAGIKVYTERGHPVFDAGYHVFIDPRAPRNWGFNFERPDDDVLLVWQPPSKIGLHESQFKIGRNFYWDAKSTFEWLVEELIPAALHHHFLDQYMQSSLLFRLRNRRPSFKTTKEEYDKDRSRYFTGYWRKSLVPICEVNTQEQLRLYSEEAQYNIHGRRSGVYLDEAGYKRIFTALAVALKYARPELFDYLHGNVSYLAADSLAELQKASIDHAEGWHGACTNGFRLDCIFRCFIVIFEGPSEPLPDELVRHLAREFEPVWQCVTRWKFLDRQNARLSS